MADDSTTDTWLYAPLDHGRAREHTRSRKRSGYAPLIWAALALAMLAAGLLTWKGGADSTEAAVTPEPAVRSNTRPDPSPPPPAANRSAEQDEQRTARITRCTSSTGTPTTFSDGPCPPGSRRDELRVRPDTNLAVGMSTAERSRSIQDNRARAQATADDERRAAAQSSVANPACAQLNAQIAALDAAARRPLPGAEQDRLRDERKRARDRQFAFGC